MVFDDGFIASVDVTFIVRTIKDSEGGYKLSQEALTAIAILAGGHLYPAGRRGVEILMSAHNHVWKDASKLGPERLEACQILWNLALTFIE